MSEQSQSGAQFTAPKKKNKWVKRLIILAVVIIAVVLLVSRALSKGQSQLAGNFLPAQAETRELTVAVTGTGTVQPNDSYRATAAVRGEVLTAPFAEGDRVEKDDVLFTIDTEDAESAIKQAQTTVEQATLSVRSAQLNYDNLIKNQNDANKDREVKANAGGVVTRLYVEEGDTVMAGAPIADILDRDNMKLTLPFHTVDVKTFWVGASAAVTVTGTAEVLPGTVTDIAVTDTVGPGGALVRNVTISVVNPGALSNTSSGSAVVEGAASASTGSFQYAESKQLTAKASGELESLTISEGDRVSDGQVVGRLKETDMQSQIDAAAISLENARLSLRTAQDNLSRTQDALEDYTITTPIAGTVVEMNYEAGDEVNLSTAAATGNAGYMALIYDMSRLTFTVNVDERDIGRVSVGQKVTVTADALDGESFGGRVDRVSISGAVMSGKTTYPVTVVLEGDGLELVKKGLFPGMNVSASVIVEETGPVLTVPVDAVTRGNIVKVAGPGALDEAGNLIDAFQLEEREVVLGRNDEDYIEVLSGLSEGETVYIEVSPQNLLSLMMSGRG